MMNEKLINELMWKAGAKFEMMNWVHYDNFSYEKFAELIVKECGVALRPMLRDMVSRGQAFDLIKEHFGVE
jgi:hypothetical protein